MMMNLLSAFRRTEAPKLPNVESHSIQLSAISPLHSLREIEMQPGILELGMLRIEPQTVYVLYHQATALSLSL